MKLVEKKLNGEETLRVAEMNDLMDHETMKVVDSNTDLSKK